MHFMINDLDFDGCSEKKALEDCYIKVMKV